VIATIASISTITIPVVTVVDGNQGVDCVTVPVNDGVEAVVVVSGVGHGTHRAVGLHQAVLTLHHVAVAFLPLALLVSCVGIVNRIVEGVARVRLSGTEAEIGVRMSQSWQQLLYIALHSLSVYVTNRC
jgi:hypothetical protein